MPLPIGADSNTVLAWDLGERGDATSFANTGSGSGPALTKAGNPFPGQPGSSGYCCWFPGVYGPHKLDSGSTSSGEVAGNVISMSALVEVGAYGGNGGLFGKAYSGSWAAPYLSAGFYWLSGSGSWQASIVVGGTQRSITINAGAGLVALRQKTLLWLTYDGTTLTAGRHYIDAAGVVQGGALSTLAVSGSIDWGAHGPWFVGDNPFYGPEPTWPCTISKCRVDNVARTPSFFATLLATYRDTTPKTRLPTTDELIHVKFNEAAGATSFANVGSAGGSFAIAIGTGFTAGVAGPLGNALQSAGTDRNALTGPATPEPAYPITLVWRGRIDAFTGPGGLDQHPFFKEYNYNGWTGEPYVTAILNLVSGGSFSGSTTVGGTRAATPSVGRFPIGVDTAFTLVYDGTTMQSFIGTCPVGSVSRTGALDYFNHAGRWCFGSPTSSGAPEPIVGVNVDARLFNSAKNLAWIDSYLSATASAVLPADTSVKVDPLLKFRDALIGNFGSQIEGADVSTIPDLDPTFALQSAEISRAERCARLITTPRGSLTFYEDRCVDIRDYLNKGLTQRDLGRLKATIEAEIKRDEEILDAVCFLSLDAPSRTLNVSVKCATATGPFVLTLRVTSLSVDILAVK